MSKHTTIHQSVEISSLTMQVIKSVLESDAADTVKIAALKAWSDIHTMPTTVTVGNVETSSGNVAVLTDTEF